MKVDTKEEEDIPPPPPSNRRPSPSRLRYRNKNLKIPSSLKLRTKKTVHKLKRIPSEMPSPVRRETHKNQKYVEGKPKSLMKSSYLTRPTDFLLGTKTGQFVSIMVMWVFLVFLGALFFYWAGGSRAMDLGLPHDNFWDSLWASYVLFIDIGTQTGMKTSDSTSVLLVGVTISLVGFLFLLVILGVAVDIVRDKLEYFEALHERIVENDHTIILGWNDKVLFLAEEMAMMMLSTRENFQDNSSSSCIVIMSNQDEFEIISDLGTAFGWLSGDSNYAFRRRSLLQSCYIHGIRVKFIKGDRTDPYDLERISLLSAKYVVSVANPTLSDLEADQGVLRTIMATKVVQLHDSTASDLRNWIGPNIVAETRLLDNITVASRLGGDMVRSVTPRVIVNMLLALCSLTPCLGKALQSLMSFDMGCEIYAIQMSNEKWSNYVGLTVREICLSMSDLIVLAVKRDGSKQKKSDDDEEEDDEDEMKSYLRPHHAGKLLKTDLLVVVSHNISKLNNEAENMRTNISSESSKASLRKRSTENLHSMRDMMIKSDKIVDRNMSSMKNYCWDRHLRQVVIMGWATDLFDLIRTFILISANVWSDEQGQMPLEVHILGGPPRTDIRRRYWCHFAGQDSVLVNRNGTIEIDVVVTLSDRKRVHSTKVFHYAGRPSRASSLRKLPLKSASAVLILSDDDNDVALASDSQCLTNLILTAQICNNSDLEFDDDNVDIFDEEDDHPLPLLGRHASISYLVGNALPSIKVRAAITNSPVRKDKEEKEEEVPPPLPPGLEMSKSTLAGKPPTMHVVCEILSPSTPKMVRVVKKPFTSDQDNEKSSSSSSSSPTKSDKGTIESSDTIAEVNYFCTYKLETAILATHCYDKTVTKVFECIVKSIQTQFRTENPFTIEAVQCSTIILSQSWPTSLSFRDIETVLYGSCKRVLLGWMRDGTHESKNDTDSIDGMCINPNRKDDKILFDSDDILILM